VSRIDRFYATNKTDIEIYLCHYLFGRGRRCAQYKRIFRDDIEFFSRSANLAICSPLWVPPLSSLFQYLIISCFCAKKNHSATRIADQQGIRL
jgi:hypothetical protein